jgi:uncharacterized damage-inducible protein DinB
MSIAQSILPEFDHETANTRKVLERVPEAYVAWKPHAKSYSLGDLALHLANLPVWAGITLKQSEFDVDPPGGGPGRPTRVWESGTALLKTFDENVAAARGAIAETSDEEMMRPWTLKKAGKAQFTQPKIVVLRSFVMNHSIHHRGQLTVYLRLKDVPLPFIYGPTADEGN